MIRLGYLLYTTNDNNAFDPSRDVFTSEILLRNLCRSDWAKREISSVSAAIARNCFCGIRENRILPYVFIPLDTTQLTAIDSKSWSHSQQRRHIISFGELISNVLRLPSTGNSVTVTPFSIASTGADPVRTASIAFVLLTNNSYKYCDMNHVSRGFMKSLEYSNWIGCQSRKSTANPLLTFHGSMCDLICTDISTHENFDKNSEIFIANCVWQSAQSTANRISVFCYRTFHSLPVCRQSVERYISCETIIGQLNSCEAYMGTIRIEWYLCENASRTLCNVQSIVYTLYYRV